MTKLHHRNIRLPKYDYSREGSYFVTICAQDRLFVFGDIAEKQMKLNKWGLIVEQCWHNLVKHYTGIELDAFVIMPNHVHGIIKITGNITVGDGFKPSPTGTGENTKTHGLTEIVRAFKTFSARKINEQRNTQGQKVWQRNYYEHIIRNEISLDKIREYIINNPRNWHTDGNNPHRIKP